MKSKILFIIAFVAINLGVTAQTPYAFNYQSVVRDATGQLLINQAVGVQISLLQGSATGAVSYQETFTMTTNDYALINLRVGEGTVGFGVFDAIDWGNGPYFMEVSMDFSGGNNYIVMGSSQLVSVPYAIHAKTAGNTFSGDYNDLSNTPSNVSFFSNDAGYVITEMDGDSTNEIQALTLSNDTMFLSNGGYVKLPPPIFGFNGQYSGLVGAPTNVSHFNNDAGYITSELDGDSTNEIQTLSLSNDTMYLSNGGNADLSGYDNTAAINVNTAAITTNATGISTNASGITTNASGISTNSTAIAGNTTSITTNTGNISTNTTGVATNGTAIGTNATGISTNVSGIATNASGIATNGTSIAGNTTNITTNTGNISTNTTGITTNGTAISTNAAGIATNTTGVATNTSSISTHISNDLDTDSSNEIQTLSLSGTSLSLSSSNTIDLHNASVWDTNTVSAFYLGNVGIGTISPIGKLHVVGDSISVNGYSTGQNADNWQNVGVKGEVNTNSNGGRGVIGLAYGNNFGLGIRGEAATEAENQGLSGLTLSKPTNSDSQFGVFGEARKDWTATSSGTGNHYGGFFKATGEGAFNIGVRAVAETPGTGNNRGIEASANSSTALANFGVISFADGAISGTNRGVYGQSANATGTNYGMQGVANGAGTNQTGMYGYSNGTNGSNYGVDGTSEGTGAQNVGTGGFAYGTNTGSNKNYGMFAYAQNADTNYGVFSTITGSDNVNYGMYSEANGGTLTNYGMYATTNGTATGENVGVYGESVGIKATDQNVGMYGYAAGNAFENQGMYAKTDASGTLNLGMLAVSEGTGGTGSYNYGLFGRANGGALGNYGLYGTTSATTAGSYGIYGRSNGVSATSNWAVRGHATGSTGQNTGVDGTTNGTGTWNLGVFGYASGTGTNNYGVYGWSLNATNNYAGFFDGDVTITGNLNVTGSIAKGSGTFKIDHPLDPENKYLVHSFVESPEMMNVYSGNITTDANGYATVDLPTYFEAANKDFRYQLTVMGSFAQAIIKDKISGNKFVIQTNNPNIEVSWQVTGVRSDKYAESNRVVPELEKTNKGTYLHPELFGKTKEVSENAKNKVNTPVDHSNEEEPSSSETPNAPAATGNNQEFLKQKSENNAAPASPKVESKSNQKRAKAPKTEQKQVPQESAIPAKR